MANQLNNMKTDLIQALNKSDAYKAASILKDLHSQVYTIKISLSPAPYTSFAPIPITLQSSSMPHSPVHSPSPAPAIQSKTANPEIFNGLLYLGYPEALSHRVSSLTSSIPSAVDYIIKNNLS